MVKTEVVLIASGGTNSSVIMIDRRSIIRLLFPTMTSTAMTIQVSEDNALWYTLGDLAGDYSIANPSGRAVQLNLQNSIGTLFVRLVAGSAEGADRVITVVHEDYTT